MRTSEVDFTVGDEDFHEPGSRRLYLDVMFLTGRLGAEQVKRFAARFNVPAQFAIMRGRLGILTNHARETAFGRLTKNLSSARTRRAGSGLL